MSRVDIPKDDALYEQWIQNFATTALANATALGLTTGQTTQLTALSTAFANAYSASQASKFTTKGLIGSKDAMRLASEQLFRTTAKVINADPNISAGLKGDLGINVNPAPSGPVVVPTGLTVVGYDNGDNLITWKRSGNATGTAFVVEAKAEGEANFSIITTVTKVRFLHTGQTPGRQISYRVYAKRGNFQTSPCAAMTIYSASEPEVITLKQAA